jgi:hypothetical protein
MPSRAGKLLPIPAALRRPRGRCEALPELTARPNKSGRNRKPACIRAGLIQAINLRCKKNGSIYLKDWEATLSNIWKF